MRLVEWVFVSTTLYLLSACSHSSVKQQYAGRFAESVFFRTPSSEEIYSSIPFPSGDVAPSSFLAGTSDFEALQKKANASLKDKGFTAEDCVSGDSIGYHMACFLIDAKSQSKDFDLQHPLKALHLAEIAVLKWYMDFGYQPYNGALRSRDPQELAALELELKIAISALNRGSPFQGSVVRCDLTADAKEPDLLERIEVANLRYSEAKVYQTKSFLSTSLGTHPDYIESWIKPCRVQLNLILKKSGVLVQELSSRPSEQEVLVRPLTRFKVLRKEIGVKDGIPFHMIDLEEVLD